MKKFMHISRGPALLSEMRTVGARAVISITKGLVFSLKRIIVPKLCVAISVSGQDRISSTVSCLGSIAQVVFQVWKYFMEFVSGFIVPNFLRNHNYQCTSLSLLLGQTNTKLNGEPKSLTWLLLSGLSCTENGTMTYFTSLVK